MCHLRILNLTSAAGRGGLGAVLGSKRVKAIVVDDTGAEGCPSPIRKNSGRLQRYLQRPLWTTLFQGKGLAAYGTDVLVNIINESGGLPSYNFTRGRIDHVDNISGETRNANITERGGDGKVSHGCHRGCVIKMLPMVCG